ncbi:MAG: hypothetical protein AABX37_05825 [Nanoarchaeota archaeon]
MKVILDTNIYGRAIEKGDAEVLEGDVKKTNIIIYGNDIIRNELRNTAKTIYARQKQKLENLLRSPSDKFSGDSSKFRVLHIPFVLLPYLFSFLDAHNNYNNKSLFKHSSRPHASSKGYIYTLEVLLAMAMILVALTFLYRTPPQLPELEASTMKVQGIQVLEYLDRKGDLRQFAIVANETDIESRINNTIVSAIDFELDICTLACNETGVPRNKSVIAVDYYIAGYRAAHNVTKIKMWMWRR